MSVFIFVLILLLLFGLTKVTYQLRNISQRYDETNNYLKRYNSFLSKQTFDNEDYTWLTYRANKMQEELGDNGILDYRPPFANYIVRNYPVLLNTLPDIRQGHAHKVDMAMVQEALIRHLGQLDELYKIYRKDIFNPVIWLREGIQFIVTLPILLALWFGLVQYSSFQRSQNSFIVKFISFVFAIIGIVSSIITILLGWNQTVEMVNKFIKF